MKRRNVKVWNGRRIITHSFVKNKNYKKFLIDLKSKNYSYNRHKRRWEIVKETIKEKVKREPIIYTEIHFNELKHIPSSLKRKDGKDTTPFEKRNIEFYVNHYIPIEDIRDALRSFYFEGAIKNDNISIRYVDVSIEGLKGSEKVYNNIYEAIRDIISRG